MLTTVRRRRHDGHEARGLVGKSADLAHEPVTIPSHHRDVAQHDVRTSGLHQSQCLRRGRRRHDLGATRAERDGEVVETRLVVVDDYDLQSNEVPREQRGSWRPADDLSHGRVSPSDDKVARGMVTVKVAPFPFPGLSPRTSPPCSSTRCFTSASPSPRPPWARVLDRSSCSNGSKMYASAPGLMPMPLSLTTIRAYRSARTTATTMRPSAGVNLMAFIARFHTTCRRRSGAPRTRAPSGASQVISAMPFASAAGRTASSASSTN